MAGPVADVVVSMGGYNTVCELLTLRKRLIVVPRVRPVQEQLIRAQRMAAGGLLRMVHPDQLTPASLWQVVHAELAALSRGAPLPQLQAMGGLPQVTKALFDLVDLKAAGLAGVVPSLRPSLSDLYARPAC